MKGYELLDYKCLLRQEVILKLENLQNTKSQSFQEKTTAISTLSKLLYLATSINDVEFHLNLFTRNNIE